MACDADHVSAGIFHLQFCFCDLPSATGRKGTHDWKSCGVSGGVSSRNGAGLGISVSTDARRLEESSVLI